jgi:adenylate cyclase
MTQPTTRNPKADAIWRDYLTLGEPNIADESRLLGLDYKTWLTIFKHLPGDPRCKMCYVPFGGLGSRFVRLLIGTGRSRLNPTLCNNCENFIKDHQGGAEVPLSMLFVDVRGSTGLAESRSPAEFRGLIDRFYRAATGVMIDSGALIEKLIGDEVTALYVPGLAGPDHPRRAVESAQKILRATGHADPGGPWAPVGAGVHTGTAYVGAVGSQDGLLDIVALGDDVNVAARLAAQAGPGEVVVSQAAAQAASLDTAGLEMRHLQLKGRAEPVDVWVARVGG